MLAPLEELNTSSLYVALGIRLTEAGDGMVRSELRPEPAICWPLAAQPHGGILFTQLDTTMASAVLSGPLGAADCSTISCDIQYLAPATGACFECVGHVMRRGGRVCFVRGETRDKRGQLIALAQGTFRTFSPSS